MKNFPINKIIFFTFFALVFAYIFKNFLFTWSFLSFSNNAELSLNLNRNSFSFNPLTDLNLFRSENADFFTYESWWDRWIFEKFFILFPFGFFLPFVFPKFFASTKNTILTWFLIAFFKAVLQILLIIFSFYFLKMTYFWVFSIWEIILNFIWFLLWFWIYKILNEMYKK